MRTLWKPSLKDSRPGGDDDDDLGGFTEEVGAGLESSFVFKDDVQTGTVLVELGPKSFAIILMPFYNYYDCMD